MQTARIPKLSAVGTKYVIARPSRGACDGQVFSRYLVFPNGRCLELPSDQAPAAMTSRRRRAGRAQAVDSCRTCFFRPMHAGPSRLPHEQKLQLSGGLRVDGRPLRPPPTRSLCHVATRKHRNEGLVPGCVRRARSVSLTFDRRGRTDLSDGCVLLERCAAACHCLVVGEPAGAGAGTASGLASSMPPRSCPVWWSTCAISAHNNFIGRPIDGYEKPLCLLIAAGRRGACRGRAGSRAARARS